MTVQRLRTWSGGLMSAALLSAPACMGWPDLLDHQSKRLTGGYCLKYTDEFGHYEVQRCYGAQEQQGIVRGYVTRLGWSSEDIVAYREAVNGKAAGWVILNVASGRLEGPFSERVFELIRQQRRELQAITIRNPRDVLQ